MAIGIGSRPPGVVMVTSRFSMGTVRLIIHQFAPSLRLIHLSEFLRSCQSLGPLRTFNKVKLCQFSEHFDFAALFLLVDGARIRPRIHLPDISNSSRLEKAMKWWPFADV